jgi:hypothetical protein
MVIDPWILLGTFILLAYTIEAITGFGGTVIALSLGALVLPIDAMLPVLVPLNVATAGYLFLRYRAHVHWPTLLKLILPLMATGTLAGYLMRPWLSESLMQAFFGVLVIWFSARELWRAWHRIFPGQHGAWWTRSWVFGAGITHGLFASGGPLLVYALTGGNLPKARFRATLVSVWLTLNGLLASLFALDGSLLPATPRIAAYLPILVIGVLLGEWLHHRVNEARFRQGVFVLLLFTGLMLLIAAL